MVVMLIMSIILAAMAPVMTTRNKSDYSSPWRYSMNGSDAYFGAGEQQVALIGQHDTTGDDADTKLLINVADGSSFSHILFKKGASILGRLSLDEDNLYLSNTRPNENSERNTTVGIDALKNNTEGDDNTAIGYNALNSNTTGIHNTGIGPASLMFNTSGGGNVGVGSNALQHNTTGNNNIAIGMNSFQQNEIGGSNTIIGTSAMSQHAGNNNTVLGTQAMLNGSGDANTAIGTNANNDGGASETAYANTTAIGYGAVAHGNFSVAVGSDTIANDYGVTIGGQATSSAKGISIGYEAHAEGSGDDDDDFSPMAIGYNASTSGANAIAIGNQSRASESSSIAIGPSSSVESEFGIAIGSGAKSPSYVLDIGNNISNIAIGRNASGNSSRLSEAIAIGTKALQNAKGSATGGANNIAIGYRAGYILSGNHNIAIGSNACAGVTGSNKICIGSFSGPDIRYGDEKAWAEDDVERIFIGGKSKYDDGTAVLEVHNTTKEADSKLKEYYGDNMNETAVVVHGALVVTGPIYNYVKQEKKSTNGSNYKGWRLLEAATIDSNNTNAMFTGAGNTHYTEYSFRTTPVSDRRLKYVGKENTSGLDKIRQLKVFNYTFKKDEKKTPHVGVIAQDLQKVFPDAVKKRC